jgi:hypothetical protein
MTAPALLGMAPKTDLALVPGGMPPLRQAEDDVTGDSQRIEYFRTLWEDQTIALLPRDRMVEENLRMLAGDHWSVFHPGTGRYIDISDFLSDDEKRWRQRPVINRLLRWFILTHARGTENPPIVRWTPGPDAMDAELAETLTTITKVVWRDANMDDVLHRWFAWLIPCGSVYLLSRIDPGVGDWRTETADAPLPIVDPRTGQQLGMTPGPVPGVPLSADYQPAVFMTPDGQMQPMPGVQPLQRRSGQIAVDICTNLEVRSEWTTKPFGRRRWHALECYYTADDIWEYWGKEVRPRTGSTITQDRSKRLLYGTGLYGMASARASAMFADRAIKDLICVRHTWMRPTDRVPGMAESPGQPGGRYIAIADDDTILQDGPRPVAFPFTSPLHRWDFVPLPGRPDGTTPQEALNGPSRSYNKMRSIVMENANLLGSPKPIIDDQSGIDAAKFTNEPGAGFTANRRAGVPAVEWLAPPPITSTVLEALAQAKGEINELGNLDGTSGNPPSPSASGELVKELRFNEDRFLGPTMRRSVPEFARMQQTWRVMLPLIYDRRQILAIAGEDRMVQTVEVYPELFESGTANAEPDLESQQPEGRSERKARVERLWMAGAFGPPQSADAISEFMERSRFPHDSRVLQPAHVDFATAESENATMVAGGAPAPVLDWYDDEVHLARHERLMKRPQFLKYPPAVQQVLMQHRAQHIQALQIKVARMAKAAPPPGPAPTPAPEASR